MRLIPNGPDVPEHLRQFHEDGSVVFFCGAGISRSAGLPDFKKLIRILYREFEIDPDPEQQKAIRKGQFDTAITLLEQSVVGGRATVRTKIASILTPNLDLPGATTTHQSLITLAQDRNGRTKLVTTNFDHLFQEAITNLDVDVEAYNAPMLPVPKHRWSGIVYLHGLLSLTGTNANFDNLVLSSGDFGLAYLTERWAARFVTELFRRYNVCFVGYSLNDPVLRYMTDALAADRLLGEANNEIFVFDSYNKDKREERERGWRAKGITPILYREFKNHLYLHATLREWAGSYRDGLNGKLQIIARYADLPLRSNVGCSDDSVALMRWALSDEGGTVAKYFAELDPAPPLAWIDLLEPIVTNTNGDNRNVGRIMYRIFRWFLRHIGNPKLLLYITRLNDFEFKVFATELNWYLEELDRLEDANDTDKLNELRRNSPDSIPSPAMRILWNLVVSGRTNPSVPVRNIYNWMHSFERDSKNPILLSELRALMSPRVEVNDPLPIFWNSFDLDQSENISDLVRWQVLPTVEGAYSDFRGLMSSDRLNKHSQQLIDLFTLLLRDSLDIIRTLGEADEKNDFSATYMPSIKQHAQNTSQHDWIALIGLARDAWLALSVSDPERAIHMVSEWNLVNYPTFKRLVLFAISHDNVFSVRDGLSYLLADDHWWLWSYTTRREVLRLLVSFAFRLDSNMLDQLEVAIHRGPLREMYIDELSEEQWIRIYESEIWIRLAKLQQAGAKLGDYSLQLLDKLQRRGRAVHFHDDEREEFLSWTEFGTDLAARVPTPGDVHELAAWILTSDDGSELLVHDDWGVRCQDDFPSTAYALWNASREGGWPIRRWRAALEAWSRSELSERSWRYFAPVLLHSPDDIFLKLARQIGPWLRSVPKRRQFKHDSLLFEFCRKMMELHEDEQFVPEGGNHVNDAIANPIGQTIEALLSWWSCGTSDEFHGVSVDVQSIIDKICDIRVSKFRSGRVFVFANLQAFFAVDSNWTRASLFPVLDWDDELEASAAWQGFLWSSKINLSLAQAMKEQFLNAAKHYRLLGSFGDQYAALLTYLSLDHGGVFKVSELSRATASLPEEGLLNAAAVLERSLNAADSRRSEYWSNRVKPYFHSIWPKSNEAKTLKVSERLARVSIASGDRFPDALERLLHWFQPLERPERVFDLLSKSGLCNRFPDETLTFLDLLTGAEPFFWGWIEDLFGSDSGVSACVACIKI